MRDNEQHPISIEHARFNFSTVVEWIKFADQKATFLLTISLAMLGFALADLPAAARVLKYCYEHAYHAAMISIIVAHGLYYMVLICAVCQLVHVVKPKLARPSGKHSWFFFQSVALLTPDDYERFVQDLDEDRARMQLHDQIYNVAKVAREKYKQIACAVYWLAAAIVFALIAISPVLVVDALISSGK